MQAYFCRCLETEQRKYMKQYFENKLGREKDVWKRRQDLKDIRKPVATETHFYKGIFNFLVCSQ